MFICLEERSRMAAFIVPQATPTAFLLLVWSSRPAQSYFRPDIDAGDHSGLDFDGFFRVPTAARGERRAVDAHVNAVVHRRPIVGQ